MVSRNRRQIGAGRAPWRSEAAAGVILLAVAAGGRAQVINLDGWGTDGFVSPPITLTTSATGATVGTRALQSTASQGAFWGPSTGNLIAGTGLPGSQLAALQQATRISFDLTLLSAQINGGSGNFTGFAQANELAFQLFSNAVPSLPSGINVFAQRNFGQANGTDTSGQSATWSGVDGTRTITFDLTQFTATDPSDGQTKTIAAILTAHPDIQDAKFSFTEQTGGGSPVGPPNFFYDNVRLLGPTGNTLSTIGNFEPVPEPSALFLAGSVVPAVVVALRRRRQAAAGTNPPT
jgi:hypothetical protein